VKTSQINVEIEPGLRERVKVRAVQEGVSLRQVVENALRLWLTSPVVGTGSVAAEPVEVAAPAAERGRPTIEDLKRAGLVTTGRALAEGTTVDVTASTDPTRGKATVEVAPVRGEEARRTSRTAYGEGGFNPTIQERRAAQDRLRTHPEDASQDPEDGPGF